MTPEQARAYVERRPERHALADLAELAGLSRRRLWRACVRLGLVVSAGGRRHHVVEHHKLMRVWPGLWAQIEGRHRRAA